MQNNKTIKLNYDVGIIAAGEGVRFKTEGFKESKPMISISGKPLISWTIDAIIKNGASKINCIINEQSKDLESYLRNYKTSSKINLIIKSTESSFHSLTELIQYLHPPFMIATSDSIFREEEFNSFIEYGINKACADVIVAATNFIDDENPLYIKMDDKGRVIEFTDIGNNLEFVTGGLYLFKKEIGKEIVDAVGEKTNKMRNFLRFLITKGWKMQIFNFSKIIDVDHKKDIPKAEELLSE